MEKVSDAVLALKAKEGQPAMSDRELAMLLSQLSDGPAFTTARVSDARLYNKASDRLAGALEDALGVEPGVIVVMARAAREQDADIRRRLESFTKNVLCRVPMKAAGALGALAVALGLLLQPQPTLAHDGGSGRF